MSFSHLPLRSLLLLFWLALSLGCRASSLPPLPPDGVILAFGDSITFGVGAQRESSYPAILERISGRRVINAGLPGEVTAHGVGRLAETLEAVRPQLLILCLGGNDMLRRVTREETVHNLEQMVLLSRSHGVPVLLLAVPRPALLGLKSAPFYGELAERLAIPLEDRILTTVLADNSLRADQIHPNAAGYRMIAEAIYGKLKESGAF